VHRHVAVGIIIHAEDRRFGTKAKNAGQASWMLACSALFAVRYAD
jgi:hypothetical protein